MHTSSPILRATDPPTTIMSTLITALGCIILLLLLLDRCVAGPEKTDGHDMSGSFRSPSPTQSPRTRAVIQHDVFLNASAYRQAFFHAIDP
jgi:hypothetical protein